MAGARLGVSELRNDMSTALNRVAFGSERLLLERRGKDIAALVSVEDLRLLEALEDQALIAMADEAEAESTGRLSLEELKARLKG